MILFIIFHNLFTYILFLFFKIKFPDPFYGHLTARI